MKLRSFMRKFATDDACRAHLEIVRWPEGPVCDRCGSVNNAARASEHEFRWNVRERGVADRIARCLLGRAGRLRLRELFA